MRPNEPSERPTDDTINTSLSLVGCAGHGRGLRDAFAPRVRVARTRPAGRSGHHHPVARAGAGDGLALGAAQAHAELCLLACAILFLISGWLVAHYKWVFLLQHAGIYALLCLAFGRTLQGGKIPMVSQFAQIVHGILSPALIRYTRAATWAWTFYFGGVTTLSLALFWLAPVHIWSAFANLLNMPLLALMFAGEYAARCYRLPAADRAGPIEAIRAYRQASSNARSP